ncbi:hypothetical protein F5050DRAFT_1710012 [Lentinula boryana]|uniref:Uncharacterized protein n=1 Tax=Lentinula boryana TaxID=40481 RepID=A0ABQ8QKD5_9AGAR|nr:hypothetical protein F5050DRAFT_1710012 [Lentinula boryana]
MRFSTLSLLATVASAAFSLAAPVSPASNALEARCLCQDIHSIIVDVTTTITPLVEELTYITAENCTVEILTPIIGEIKVVLTTAITEVKGLTGFTLTAVLTTVDGVVLTLAEVAELVCVLLTLIFGALAAILKVVTRAEAAAVAELLCEVVALVATLLELICNLLGGILAILLPLVGEIVFTVIASLGLTAQFSFFHYSWAAVSSTLITSATTVYSTSVATMTVA